MERIVARSKYVSCVCLLMVGLTAVAARTGYGQVSSTPRDAAPVLPAQNLALAACGGQMRSWEPGVAVVAEHEPARAADGNPRSYWMARAESFPADLGIEWAAPQAISCVIVRYPNRDMLREIVASRTQQFARIQRWDGAKWRDLDAQAIGERTSVVVRYIFPPIATQRVRILFPEPLVLGRGPAGDDTSVRVSELEAYTRAPFQWFYLPERAAKPWQASPLIVEPKQTRVFSAALTPTLIVAESRWAEEPCVAAASAPERVMLRNGFLQLDLSAKGTVREESVTNRVTGETVATRDAEPFIIRTDKGTLTVAHFHAERASTAGSTREVARLRVDLASPEWGLSVFYELRRPDHFYHKWLTLKNKRPAEAQALDVTVSDLELPRPVDLCAGENQELTYPVTILEKGGFFSCLETIYWDHAGDALTYYPGATLKPGGSLTSEKAVVGVFKKRGDYWLGLDRGVREWVIEYHAQVSPVPAWWPDVYCEGWSAAVGLQALRARPEWMARWMRTAGRLGIRYMDGFEPLHQAMAAPPGEVDRWVRLATQNKIATGWWIDHSLVYWRGERNPRYPPFACRLSPDAERFFHGTVEFVRAHNLRAMHWGDFLQMQPCNEPGHGHLPGKYSLYAQGQRILQYGRDLRATHPGVALGADMGWYNPQIVRFLDSRAHVDNFDALPTAEPDIHLDRLYADMNRRYVRIAHAVYLHPWFRNLNCVTHYGQETHGHDSAGFRYGLLSGLAAAGQVVFNDAPDNVPESDIRFSQRWLAWARRNKDYLKQADVLFDRTARTFTDPWQGDPDSIAGYAHIRRDRGFVFLINPTAREQIAALTLALDAPAGERFQVEDVYPGGFRLRGPDAGLYPQGSVLRVTAAAKQVRILWIAPAAASASAKRRGGFHPEDASASAKRRGGFHPEDASVAAKRRGGFQPEDAQTQEFRRFVGEWTTSERADTSVTLRSSFAYPAAASAYLASSAGAGGIASSGAASGSPAPSDATKGIPVSSSAPETEWKREPWRYEKAYLVFLLSDESRVLNNSWIADTLAGPKEAPGPVRVRVNGAPKELIPFKTARHQMEGVTRCYFVALGGETKAGAANDVEIVLPIRSGLVFSGAYLDLPDQMPARE